MHLGLTFLKIGRPVCHGLADILVDAVGHDEPSGSIDCVQDRNLVAGPILPLVDKHEVPVEVGCIRLHHVSEIFGCDGAALKIVQQGGLVPVVVVEKAIIAGNDPELQHQLTNEAMHGLNGDTASLDTAGYAEKRHRAAHISHERLVERQH